MLRQCQIIMYITHRHITYCTLRRLLSLHALTAPHPVQSRTKWTMPHAQYARARTPARPTAPTHAHTRAHTHQGYPRVHVCAHACMRMPDGTRHSAHRRAKAFADAPHSPPSPPPPPPPPRPRAALEVYNTIMFSSHRNKSGRGDRSPAPARFFPRGQGGRGAQEGRQIMAF